MYMNAKIDDLYFQGTSTYYQRSYGHVTPFVAFPGYAYP